VLTFRRQTFVFVEPLASSDFRADLRPQRAEGYWLLKDLMLECEHPLAERLSKAPQQWVLENGYLAVELTYGWVTRLHVRPFAHLPRVDADWRAQLLCWLAKPESLFLKQVFIDLKELEPHASKQQRESDGTALATFPWPAQVEYVSLGCESDGRSAWPRVRRLGAEQATIELVSAPTDVHLDGVSAGHPFRLRHNSRLSWSPNTLKLHLAQAPYFDRWPSWDFVFEHGRWRLVWRHGMPRSTEVKVSGLEFLNLALLDGDEIEVEPNIVLRFRSGEHS
jgi:hypothetical protein